MVRKPPPGGHCRAALTRARTGAHASARAPGSGARLRRAAAGRARRWGPAPSAHLKRSAAADWRARRGWGGARAAIGRVADSCQRRPGRPVAPPARRGVLKEHNCRAWGGAGGKGLRGARPHGCTCSRSRRCRAGLWVLAALPEFSVRPVLLPASP